MTERVNVRLAYEGAAVANGTMDINDAIVVLQGFQGAYSRIANTINPALEHRLTVTAVEQGSIEFVLEAIAENPEAVAAALEVARSDPAVKTLRTLFDLIRLKLHVRGATASVRAKGNNIEFNNNDSGTMVVTQDVNNFYVNGTVNVHIEKLTRPLNRDGIDAAVYSAQPHGGNAFSQRVDAQDRVFLDADTSAVSERMEDELIVTFATLTKKTNKGYLYMSDDKRVPFQYVGDDTIRLHAVFGTYNGHVKAKCKLTIREHRGVVYVTIYDFWPMEKRMFSKPAIPDSVG